MRDTYVMSDASGEIGRIVRTNVLSRRLLFEAATGVPREICLFLIWIALMVQRRTGASSSS